MKECPFFLTYVLTLAVYLPLKRIAHRQESEVCDIHHLLALTWMKRINIRVAVL